MANCKRRGLGRTLLLAASATLLVLGSAVQGTPEDLGDSVPVLEPGGPGAATNLESEVDCNRAEIPGGFARLRWTVAQNPGQEQMVVVTIFLDGFDTGKFESSKSLRPTDNTLVFDQVRGQALHRWRVLTRQAEGWVPSETARFQGPLCVHDEIQQEPVIP